MLLDATLAEYMVAAIEPCRAARPVAAYCTEDVIGDATLHPVLFEALFECHRGDIAQASRLGKRGVGRPCVLDAALVVARIVGPCFGSFSSITNADWLDEELDIAIQIKLV